jgi:hypothetical protein
MIGPLIFGLVLMAAGVAAWTGVWRSWMALPIAGRGAFSYFFFGLGAMLLSLAALGWHWLAVPAVASIFFGVVALIWQPRWLAPGWYKSSQVTALQSTPMIATFKAARGGRRLEQPLDPTGALALLESRATLIQPDQPLLRVGGVISRARSGRLALFEDRLAFAGDSFDRRISGERLHLAIPLRQMSAIELTSRSIRKSLRAQDLGGMLALRRQIHVVAAGGDYFFLPRRQKRWAAVLTEAVRRTQPG